MFEFMGWKDRRGRWIWEEMILDIVVLSAGAMVVVILAYAYL